MNKKSILFVSFLLFSLTYSLLVQSQEERKTKNCSEVQILLLSEKEKLQISAASRKQVASDYSASIQNLIKDKNIGSKKNKEIQDFNDETKSIIKDIENLIFKLDRLLLLNCSDGKDFFLEKVKSLNADYLNLIKKEEKHIKSFENNVYPILKEIQ